MSSAPSPGYDPMTVAFVSGITGQDGSYLLERLLADGVEVHGMVRVVGELPPELNDALAQVELHRADLADGPRLTALVREIAPNEIYNLAGISSVALSWREPALTGAVNGVAVTHLLEAAWQLQESCGLPVSFVQASSAEIFGQPATSPQDELTPVAPTNPYGAAKAYAHHMVGIYRARGLAASSCILFNHESPRRPATFVTRKITKAVARIAHDGGGTITLGNLHVRRDWGWAPDYVDALVRTARHEGGHDFVIATGRTHSVAEFAATALAHVGITDWEQHVDTDPQFSRPNDATELVGHASKARHDLGWQPTVDFRDLVGAMVDHDLIEKASEAQE
jgi:GDPmannose 4,6-dehydratase